MHIQKNHVYLSIHDFQKQTTTKGKYDFNYQLQSHSIIYQ